MCCHEEGITLLTDSSRAQIHSSCDALQKGLNLEQAQEYWQMAYRQEQWPINTQRDKFDSHLCSVRTPCLNFNWTEEIIPARLLREDNWNERGSVQEAKSDLACDVPHLWFQHFWGRGRWISVECKASLGYLVRTCLKAKQKRTKQEWSVLQEWDRKGPPRRHLFLSEISDRGPSDLCVKIWLDRCLSTSHFPLHDRRVFRGTSGSRDTAKIYNKVLIHPQLNTFERWFNITVIMTWLLCVHSSL